MLSSLSLPHDISLSDRICIYAQDRDELLERLYERYPQLRGLYPSALVENVITDVCHYYISERPLPKGQVALCSVGSRHVVYFNSRLADFVDSEKVNLEALRCTAMAHELGHVRSHQDEMEEGEFISYQEDGRFRDARSYQKEDEADLYSSVFLVPLELLEKAGPFREMVEARAKERPVGSGMLWAKVYKLAAAFGVTPTLMCRSLETYGWIVKEPRKRKGLHDLRLVGAKPQRSRR